MAAKAQISAQQTTRSGQAVTTTFNGQQKKMKNSNVLKTVLAPNAPWPKWETQEKKPNRVVGLKTVRIALENTSLDYFLKTHEELNQSKIATEFRIRDKLSGRFKSN